DQPLYTVQSHAAVIADDAAAAVGIGQAREHVGAATAPNVGRVSIENTVVVGLAIFGKRFNHVRVRLEAVSLERAENHAETAVRHDGPLQGSICLQSYDNFVVAVDVARRVRGDRRGDL